MAEHPQTWICCQLGAREHYAIPRALHQAEQLAWLITDAWIPPQSALNTLPNPLLRMLRDRFHLDLEQANVTAFTPSLLKFEIEQRLSKTGKWERIIARNAWFQRLAVRQLEVIGAQYDRSIRPTLFCYSYAALALLRFAKARGWRTVLGQIDPGPVEEAIVLAEHLKYPTLAPTWHPAPESYWKFWQEECMLADQIMVNSAWSSQALRQVGVPEHKICLVPLAYSPPQLAKHFERTYPAAFSQDRPLRVLFLGQVILRKGIAALIEAAYRLRHAPVEFWIVGGLGITLPSEAKGLQNIKWIGAIPRSAVTPYYQQADVFLFPTLSDGFGLTQLEAQTWKLPLVVSRFCGEVVKSQINGLVLPDITAEAILAALQFCLNHPQQLETFSKQSIDTGCFSLSQLQSQLQELSYALI